MRPPMFLVIGSAILMGFCLPIRAEDWPSFRGLRQDGFSPETGINKDWATKSPVVLWRFAMSDDGFAGPSVADGKVFIQDHKGKEAIVRALSLDKGEPLWEFVHEDTDQQIDTEYGFNPSTPTYDAGKLYVLSRMGLLHCLDAKTGAKIWRRDIVAEFKGKRPRWDLAMSPLIDGRKLIVMPGGPDAEVAALDKETGQTIWAGGGSYVPGFATPVIATIGGIRQYILFDTYGLGGVDAETGKRLWSFRWETPADCNAAMPLVMGDTVFITSNYGRGCALVRVTGDKAEKVWENKGMHSHFSSPLFHQGYIYGTTDPGRMLCMDPKDGKVIWQQKGFEKGGCMAADGTIIALDGKTGDLVMVRFDPVKYTELGRITPLGGQSWTAPILAHGKLLIRNRKELACLSLR